MREWQRASIILEIQDYEALGFFQAAVFDQYYSIGLRSDINISLT